MSRDSNNEKSSEINHCDETQAEGIAFIYLLAIAISSVPGWQLNNYVWFKCVNLV